MKTDNLKITGKHDFYSVNVPVKEDKNNERSILLGGEYWYNWLHSLTIKDPADPNRPRGFVFL